jgi:hypothetical protein
MAHVAAGGRNHGGRARIRSGRLGPVETLVLIGASLAILVIAAIYSPGQRVGTGQPSDIQIGADPDVVQGLHVNQLGGYAFAPPPEWVVRDRGSASELISPEGDVVVSFGTGRPGSLRDAAQALLETIRDTYAGVRAGALQATEVGARPAFVASGGLTGPSGTRVRFLGMSIRIGGENRVIGVFVSQPADAAEVLPVVERVIGSFRAA